MTDDARRPNEARIDADDDRHRALLYAARRDGGICAGCGRALADAEPVWWAPFMVRGPYGRLSRRWGPVGRECAPPELLLETEAAGPKPCLACGRGVHYGSTAYPRDFVLCSGRCRNRYEGARAKEARGS